MAADKDSKQVFDVSKPGKSAPSATSRPVIVGHGSMLRDPMMQDDTKDDKEEEDTPVTARSKVVIKPVDASDSDNKSEKEEPDAEKKPEVAEKKIEPAEERPTAEADDKPEEKSAIKTEEKPEATKSADDEAAVSALAEQAVKKKKEEVSQEEIAKQEAYEKLIEEKKYFLPIGKATKRRHTQHFLTFLFVILLLASSAYLTVDSGLVETDVKLPVDLIKN